MEMVDSVEELKSSRSVCGKKFPNFEMLDGEKGCQSCSGWSCVHDARLRHGGRIGPIITVSHRCPPTGQRGLP